MRKTIDWKKIWNKLDDWWQNSLRNKMSCKTCGHVKSLEIDWDEQQAKIQQLVNAQVREIVKNKTQNFTEQVSWLHV